MLQLDCEDLLNEEFRLATIHAWSSPSIGDLEVAKVCFELQLKGFDDAQEAYRLSLKSSDALLAFGGATVAWLAIFISKTHGVSFGLACVAGLAAGASICCCLVSRIAPVRPAVQSVPLIHNALKDSDSRQSYDWLARDLWVSRRGLSLMIGIINRRVMVSIYFQCAAVVLSVTAICLS